MHLLNIFLHNLELNYHKLTMNAPGRLTYLYINHSLGYIGSVAGYIDRPEKLVKLYSNASLQCECAPTEMAEDCKRTSAILMH